MAISSICPACGDGSNKMSSVPPAGPRLLLINRRPDLQEAPKQVKENRQIKAKVQDRAEM